MTMTAQQIKHVDKECDEGINGPVKAIPPNWTVWDKIIIKGPKTIEQLIEYILIEFKVNTILISSNGITIFQNITSENNENKQLKIEDIYFKEASQREIKTNKNFLILKINGECENKPVIMPLYKYIFNDNIYDK